MDREHLEEAARRRRDPNKPTGADGAAGPLAAQIGNRAMGQVVRSLQRSGIGGSTLDADTAAEITARRGGGQPLDGSTRDRMESAIGTDFSGVRVHTDAAADGLSRSLQAEAFTTGSDVFFRSGKFDPGSDSGQRLLAHELTHVVQQSSAPPAGDMRVSDPDDSSEREAHAIADTVDLSAPAPASDPSTSAVARAEDAGAAMPEEEVEEGTVGASLAREEAAEEEEEMAG